MDINTNFSVIAPDSQSRANDDTHKVRRLTREEQSPAIEVGQSLRTTSNADTLNKAHRFAQDSGYDQPQGKANQAVQAYMSHERESQRDTIRTMMGVDLYA
ncbi:hypothetical protein [Alteromonas lipotrueiana]|uniref:hypothetical protein n=1 Tax=Alteromonas lipotrueiana TaxID=2803815 RepID=UPI001C47A6D1|nr:hypothetical protein [Alteromonas lipotrueiana]